MDLDESLRAIPDNPARALDSPDVYVKQSSRQEENTHYFNGLQRVIKSACPEM
jgi:hypothetical protein